MKKLKIILLCVVGVCVFALLGLFIYVKNFDVNQFRPQIVDRLSEMLGHEVSIEHMDMTLSLADGVNLKVYDFSIQDMLLVKAVALNVDAMTFIKDKKLVVKNVNILDPIIHLIQDSKGQNNFSTLGYEETESRYSDAPVKSFDNQPLMDFNIQQLSVQNGTFVFMVRSKNDVKQSVSFHDISFNLQGFKFVQPVPFSGGVGVFSNKQNIQAQGTLFVDPVSQKIELNNVRMDTDLSDIDIALLQESFPTLMEVNAFSTLKGALRIDVHQLALSPKDRPDINIDIILTNGQFDSHMVDGLITDIKMNGVIDQERIDFKNIHAQLLSGQLDGNFVVDHYLEKGKLKGKIKIDGVDLRRSLSGQDLPVELDGVVGADVNFDAELIPEFKPDSMLADVSLYVDQAKVVDLNILEEILSKLSFIPNLSEKVYANLSPEYKEKLNVKGTELSYVALKGTIKSGVMNYVFKAEADEFLVTSEGDIDLAFNLNNQMFVRIPERLSTSFVQSVEELRFLLDDKGQMAIPFKPYSGPAENITFEPHIEKVGQKVIQQKGKEELRKVIFKALDIEDDSHNTNPDQPSQQPKKSNEQQLIEGILNEIPLFK